MSNFEEILYNQLKIIRSMIQHEDNLRSQRLNWLLVFQGFLFAIVGNIFVENKADELYCLIQGIFAIGIISSISVWYGSTINGEAIRKLRKKGNNFEKILNQYLNEQLDYNKKTLEAIINENSSNENSSNENKRELIAPVVGLKTKEKFFRCIYPWNALPWLLIGIWAFVYYFLHNYYVLKSP